jgi:hypothetical protein
MLPSRTICTIECNWIDTCVSGKPLANACVWNKSAIHHQSSSGCVTLKPNVRYRWRPRPSNEQSWLSH